MIDAIQAELSLVERTHGVKVLYAVESGSRVWGFASPDSDWDVRFVYLRPLTWHVTAFDRRDVIEMQPHDDLDCTGWELSKVMFQLYKGNPQLYEWLYSPQVYRQWDNLELLRKLAGGHFNHKSAIYHYLHMADGNYRTYLKGDTVWLKKYFYVLRPLLCCQFIQDQGGVPPVDFDTLIQAAADWSAPVHSAVQDLLLAKKAGGELGHGASRPEVNAWIELKLEHFSKGARTTARKHGGHQELDSFLHYCLWDEMRGVA